MAIQCSDVSSTFVVGEGVVRLHTSWQNLSEEPSLGEQVWKIFSWKYLLDSLEIKWHFSFCYVRRNIRTTTPVEKTANKHFEQFNNWTYNNDMNPLGVKMWRPSTISTRDHLIQRRVWEREGRGDIVCKPEIFKFHVILLTKVCPKNVQIEERLLPPDGPPLTPTKRPSLATYLPWDNLGEIMQAHNLLVAGTIYAICFSCMGEFFQPRRKFFSLWLPAQWLVVCALCLFVSPWKSSLGTPLRHCLKRSS